MKHLKTVEDVITFLQNYPKNAVVFFDMNPINGGTFEFLVPHPDNDSPLNNPRSVAFVSTKGW